MKKRDKKDIDWEDYELYDIEDDEESSFDFKSIIDTLCHGETYWLNETWGFQVIEV